MSFMNGFFDRARAMSQQPNPFAGAAQQNPFASFSPQRMAQMQDWSQNGNFIQRGIGRAMQQNPFFQQQMQQPGPDYGPQQPFRPQPTFGGGQRGARPAFGGQPQWMPPPSVNMPLSQQGQQWMGGPQQMAAQYGGQNFGAGQQYQGRPQQQRGPSRGGRNPFRGPRQAPPDALRQQPPVSEPRPQAHAGNPFAGIGASREAGRTLAEYSRR